jgi:hypothetical protein
VVSWYARYKIRYTRAALNSVERSSSPAVLLVAAAAVGVALQTPTALAHAAPAPEVEYVYNVAVRRHYVFPNNDAISYGYGICDKVGQSESYAQIMGDVKREITPNDEFASNFLISYAVSLLCPAQVWQLRNSAGGYRSPGGETGPSTYY